MEAPVITFPRTVEDVFKDYKARRAALLNALTADVEEFFRKCDPEKDNLCLYGFPNETWEVNLPAEEVPPELPEPALGINFARDGMHRRDWLSLVAAHSDAWLMAVAFYFGARFEKNERMHLFSLINELPTVFDVVTGRRAKERVNNNNAPIRNNYPGKTQLAERKARNTKPPQSQEQEDSTDDDDDDDDVGNDDDDANEDDHENDHDDGDDYDAEHGDTACGSCGGRYTDDEFWIGCDICEGWFHGRCVKVTPARAEHIKQYKCPSCTSKRARV